MMHKIIYYQESVTVKYCRTAPKDLRRGRGFGRKRGREGWKSRWRGAVGAFLDDPEWGGEVQFLPTRKAAGGVS